LPRGWELAKNKRSYKAQREHLKDRKRGEKIVFFSFPLIIKLKKGRQGSNKRKTKFNVREICDQADKNKKHQGGP